MSLHERSYLFSAYLAESGLSRLPIAKQSSLMVPLVGGIKARSESMAAKAENALDPSMEYPA